MKTIPKRSDTWTYIRIRQETATAIKVLKARRRDVMFDETLQYLLNREKLDTPLKAMKGGELIK
jgi:hypothetical protein